MYKLNTKSKSILFPIIGSNIPYIYFKGYSKEKVNVLDLEEQTQIANSLTNFEKNRLKSY